MHMHVQLTHAAIVTCLAIVLIAAVFDLVSRRIPNVLTLGGVLIGIALHAAVSGPRGAFYALVGALVCAIVPIMGFIRGEMGGGDVKLFAAIGALAGPSLGIDAQAFTFIVVLLVLWPWRLVRAGALRQTVMNAVARARAFVTRSPAPEFVPVKVAPVVLGPSILIGLALAVVRHGGLS
jgi:prepilin peptidase CpaA